MHYELKLQCCSAKRKGKGKEAMDKLFYSH